MRHATERWKVDESLELPLAVIHDDEDGEGICEIGGRTPENLMRANWIAAAPEMLAALQSLLDCTDTNHDNLDQIMVETIEQARAAIAKATRG